MNLASPIFLGLDAGTTSIKAALFDDAGKQLAVNRQAYELEMPAPGIVELDSAVYWESCGHAVRSVLQTSQVSPKRIASLTISSQGETLIPVDNAGQPTRKAIVWLDNRAVIEAGQIADAFDQQTVYQTTGQPEVTPTWPATKVLWLRRNEPETFAASARFLLLEDYLIYRLTGRYVAELSLHTSSLWLDIQGKQWWQPMLDMIGISSVQLGELIEPGVVVGPLRDEAANQLGLTTGTKVVSGGLDQVMGALGAGNLAPGLVTETTGSALAVVATTKTPIFDPEFQLPCHYHAIPDTYCLLPWGQTAGMALQWFRDRFYTQEMKAARAEIFDLITEEASTVPAGSEGLLVLPHLDGAACPEFNPAARGVFFGAGLWHGRGHFGRAIMEAVAYMLKKNLDIVEGLGVSVKEIRSMGGGSRSPLWLQIKADVLQKPVTVVTAEESGCLGAAVLGAVAIGHFNSLAEATVHMVQVRRTIQPDPDNTVIYRQGYARYQELYERLAPMFLPITEE